MNKKLLLDEVKEYVVIEGNEEDNLISSLILGAKAYLKNAGVKEVLEGDEDYEEYSLVVKMIVGQMYENRIEGSAKHNPSYCLSLTSLITQLASRGGNK